jgi:hypothetical protein
METPPDQACVALRAVATNSATPFAAAAEIAVATPSLCEAVARRDDFELTALLHARFLSLLNAGRAIGKAGAPVSANVLGEVLARGDLAVATWLADAGLLLPWSVDWRFLAHLLEGRHFAGARWLLERFPLAPPYPGGWRQRVTGPLLVDYFEARDLGPPLQAAEQETWRDEQLRDYLRSASADFEVARWLWYILGTREEEERRRYRCLEIHFDWFRMCLLSLGLRELVAAGAIGWDNAGGALAVFLRKAELAVAPRGTASSAEVQRVEGRLRDYAGELRRFLAGDTVLALMAPRILAQPPPAREEIPELRKFFEAVLAE